MCQGAHMEVRGQLCGLGCLLPLWCGSWGANSGCRACVASAFTWGAVSLTPSLRPFDVIFVGEIKGSSLVILKNFCFYKSLAVWKMVLFFRMPTRLSANCQELERIPRLCVLLICLLSLSQSPVFPEGLPGATQLLDLLERSPSQQSPGWHWLPHWKADSENSIHRIKIKNFTVLS